MSQTLCGINLENVFVSVEQKEATWNMKRHSNFFLTTGVGKSVIFQLSLFVFDSWHESTKSFILVLSLYDAKTDKTIFRSGHSCFTFLH